MPFVLKKDAQVTTQVISGAVEELNIIVDMLQLFYENNLFTDVHAIIGRTNSESEDLLTKMDSLRLEIIERGEKLGYEYVKPKK